MQVTALDPESVKLGSHSQKARDIAYVMQLRAQTCPKVWKACPNVARRLLSTTDDLQLISSSFFASKTSTSIRERSCHYASYSEHLYAFETHSNTTKSAG